MWYAVWHNIQEDQCKHDGAFVERYDNSAALDTMLSSHSVMVTQWCSRWWEQLQSTTSISQYEQRFCMLRYYACSDIQNEKWTLYYEWLCFIVVAMARCRVPRILCVVFLTTLIGFCGAHGASAVHGNMAHRKHSCSDEVTTWTPGLPALQKHPLGCHRLQSR